MKKISTISIGTIIIVLFLGTNIILNVKETNEADKKIIETKNATNETNATNANNNVAETENEFEQNTIDVKLDSLNFDEVKKVNLIFNRFDKDYYRKSFIGVAEEIEILDDFVKYLDKYDSTFILEEFSKVTTGQAHGYTAGYILGIDNSHNVELIDYSNAIKLPKNTYVLGISEDKNKVLVKSVRRLTNAEMVSKYYIYDLNTGENLYNFFDYYTIAYWYNEYESTDNKDLTNSFIIEKNSSENENVEEQGVVSISPNYEYIIYFSDFVEYKESNFGKAREITGVWGKNIETGKIFEIISKEEYEQIELFVNQFNFSLDQVIWLDEATAILPVFDPKTSESNDIRFMQIDFKTKEVKEILSINSEELLKLYQQCVIYDEDYYTLSDIVQFYTYDEKHALMNIGYQRLFKVNLFDGNIEEIQNPVSELAGNENSNSAFIGKSIVSENDKYLLYRMPIVAVTGSPYYEIYDTFYDLETETYGTVDTSEYSYSGTYLYDRDTKNIIQIYSGGSYLYPRQIIN